MQSSKFFWTGAVVVLAGGLTTVSLTLGQSQPASQPPAGKTPAEASRPTRDLTTWSFFQKEIYFTAQRGCEWLQRHNTYDGRFSYSHVPALRGAMEPDGILYQAGAAFALAKASRYFKDEKATALARQAILTLVQLDTGLEDPKNPTVRICTLPRGMANDLAAGALLVQAIHEVPAPASDLLDASDQLCNYLRRAARPDGSLNCGERGPDGLPQPGDDETSNLYSGEVLYALARSQEHRPAPWKLDIVRKALPCYQTRWRASKNLAMLPRHAAAFAEAFELTRDPIYADFVFEINDWLCGFQYHQLDPLHPLWMGGFMGCVDGRPVQTPPHAGSAASLLSLVEGARVARLVGDTRRFDRYKDALERGLQFLTTLQYTDANTQHFADWYRPALVGAVHVSQSDSNIRLDATQQTIGVAVGYLRYVKEAP
jgi:hypothetical protein